MFISVARASGLLAVCCHVIERVENRQPSAMVKVFAAFRVSLRTHARSIGSRTDFVVMEDLFWNMPMISKTFDLKGSQRNRMTKESVENSVLLGRVKIGVNPCRKFSILLSTKISLEMAERSEAKRREA